MAKYTSVDEWIKYNADYYCGSNISIFFGGIWVDDIVTFQYSAPQSKVPLFGYASQQFDGVAKGQFLVQGQFTVAFKEIGYLYLIMDRIRSTRVDSDMDEIAFAKRAKELKNLGLDFRKVDASLFDPAKTPIMGYNTKDGITSPIVSRLSVERTLNQGPGEAGFESLAEALEDGLWGIDTLSKKRITRPDQFDLDGEDIGVGFDIIITYGDSNKPGADHTVQSINNVHITDVSQVLMPTGDPIAEQYSFFARGLNEAISGFRKNFEYFPKRDVPDSLASDKDFNDPAKSIVAVPVTIKPVRIVATTTVQGQEYIGLKGRNDWGPGLVVTEEDIEKTLSKIGIHPDGYKTLNTSWSNELEPYIYWCIVKAIHETRKHSGNVEIADMKVLIFYNREGGTEQKKEIFIGSVSLASAPTLKSAGEVLSSVTKSPLGKSSVS